MSEEANIFEESRKMIFNEYQKIMGIVDKEGYEPDLDELKQLFKVEDITRGFARYIGDKTEEFVKRRTKR